MQTLRRLAKTVLILTLSVLMVIAIGKWWVARKSLRGFDASIDVSSSFPALADAEWRTSGVLLELDQGYIFIGAARSDGKDVDEGGIARALVGKVWEKESDSLLHRTDNKELLCEIIPVGPNSILLAQVPRSHLANPWYLASREEALKLARKAPRAD